MADVNYDAVIIGGGHNGLTLALYLARNGMEVGVFERRNEYGGGLCTEELTLPGFYHNCHSELHTAINFMPVYQDFNLEERGAKYLYPEAQIGVVLEDEKALILYNKENLEASLKEISKFSERDAETFRSYSEMLGNKYLINFLQWMYNPPFPFNKMSPLEEIVLNPESGLDPLWAFRSPGDLILEIFESEEIRNLLFRFSRDIICPADRHGMGLLFLGAFFVLHNNIRMCLGGSHNLAHAMGRALVEMGGKILPNCEVDKVLIENGEAKGIRLVDGREIGARRLVASGVDVHQTLLRFIGKENLTPKLIKRVENFRYDSEVEMYVAFALHEWPQYKASSFNPDVDKTFSLAMGKGGYKGALQQQMEIAMGKIPETPGFTIYSNFFDKYRAPEGKYALEVDYDFLSARHLTEKEWLNIKKTFPDRVLKEWQGFAPNMTWDNVIKAAVYTPYDIAKKHIDMREGNWALGDMAPDQIYRFRPFPECSNYKTPVKNLYMCAACTHPGGGIFAACGYNAYKVIAQEHGLEKVWEKENRAY